MNHKRILAFAACSGASAVILGAFGSHGLDQAVENGKISEAYRHGWETAVKYQFYHTLILFIIPALSNYFNSKLAKYASICFISGICLFSGSLYLMSVGPILFNQTWHWLGPITPFGGLFLISGWILLAISAIRKK